MQIKIGLWLVGSFIFQTAAISQTNTPVSDTLTGSDSALITQAFGANSRSLSTAVVRQVVNNNADRTNKTSLVGGFNTVAGVRMEERSPGSYRLNIRGSSLRSPFGVRNIKMYFNDIPFTDAGGNTYFNQLAINTANTLVIVKGPAGSMYGAGTGGLVLMQSLAPNQAKGISAEYSAGSFGLHNVLVAADFGKAENRNHISYAHNQSDGYRNQSAMRRDNAAWTSQLKSTNKQQLTATLLYTNMEYETPGGLTLAEYNANPKAARPAAGGSPSAEAVDAAIYQQNVLAGISNKQTLHTNWTNTTSLYGAYALIKNSAIRNYENRVEPQLGGRTVFVFEKKKDNSLWKWTTGAEYQAGFFNTQVSRNKNGQRDSLLTNDDLQFNTGFVFTQLDYTWDNRLFLTGGVSINQNKVSITRNSTLPIVAQERTYRNEWAPRIVAKYIWNDMLETQASFSKGFSPPTVAELLPSTGRISTDLEAESGYNYELSNDIYFLQKKLRLNVSAFYFLLNNTLVQQRDASGGDYFVNAGSTSQWGIESSLQYFTFFAQKSIVQHLNVQVAHSYHHFIYEDYKRLGVDYSNNQLPGVPLNTISLLADVEFSHGFYINSTYYYNTSIMLNDANTFKAEPFHLLGARVGYKLKLAKKLSAHLFAGADNLLNKTYSLGNDINAAGNRFYNAAPARNYYGGIGFDWR
ncbi:MAG TPA: TonB-dependent receptor [Phnomibacter sp.]|nr:TonB-dependent receptor [Phnomibacter sp.]